MLSRIRCINRQGQPERMARAREQWLSPEPLESLWHLLISTLFIERSPESNLAPGCTPWLGRWRLLSSEAPVCHASLQYSAVLHCPPLSLVFLALIGFNEAAGQASWNQWLRQWTTCKSRSFRHRRFLCCRFSALCINCSLG
jgi:hypothetical protein